MRNKQEPPPSVEEKVAEALETMATKVVYETEDITQYDQLYQKHEDLEQSVTLQIAGKAKERTPKSIYFCRVAIAILCIYIFTGATYLLVRNYIIKPMGVYNDFIATNPHFHNLPSYIPNGYIPIKESTDQEEPLYAQHIRFINAETGYCLKFTEAAGELTASMDGENVSMKFVSIANRYEGTFINKEDGSTLLWEQDGYFYIIYTNDIEMDEQTLVRIASSLKES